MRGGGGVFCNISVVLFSEENLMISSEYLERVGSKWRPRNELIKFILKTLGRNTPEHSALNYSKE